MDGIGNSVSKRLSTARCRSGPSLVSPSRCREFPGNHRLPRSSVKCARQAFPEKNARKPYDPAKIRWTPVTWTEARQEDGSCPGMLLTADASGAMPFEGISSRYQVAPSPWRTERLALGARLTLKSLRREVAMFPFGNIRSKSQQLKHFSLHFRINSRHSSPAGQPWRRSNFSNLAYSIPGPQSQRLRFFDCLRTPFAMAPHSRKKQPHAGTEFR